MSTRAASTLLATLAGTAPPPALMGDDVVRRVQERAADGDLSAAEQLRTEAQLRSLVARVHSAIADDLVFVTFADGSSLKRADAERALAAREERRVYLPIRGPLLAARRQVRDPVQQRLQFDADTTALGAATPVSDVDVARLRGFLQHTADVVPALIDALSRVGHVDIDNALALERALDLPMPALVSEGALVDLVRLTREALPDHSAARLVRRAAPRALGGQLVTDAEAGRLLVAPTVGAGAHRAHLQGLGCLYARFLASPRVGHGLALLLASVPIRRALDVRASEAEQFWRQNLCASLLQARLAAAVALGWLDSKPDPDAPARDQHFQRRDEARSAARRAVGRDPGAELVDELLAPPWPNGGPLLDAAASLVARATDLLAAANAVHWLRDTVDEGALLRRRGLEPVPHLDAPSLSADGAAEAGGWCALVGEVL